MSYIIASTTLVGRVSRTQYFSRGRFRWVNDRRDAHRYASVYDAHQAVKRLGGMLDDHCVDILPAPRAPRRDPIDIRAEGFDEGISEGGQAHRCPYRLLTREHSEWMAGYESGIACREGAQ